MYYEMYKNYKVFGTVLDSTNDNLQTHQRAQDENK